MYSPRPYQLITLVAAVLFPSLSMAATGWLIATPNETMRIGEKLRLEVVRPNESTSWPAYLQLKIVSGNITRTLISNPETSALEEHVRHIYVADLPGLEPGMHKIELADEPSNRLLVSVFDAAPSGAAMTNSVAEATQRLEPMPDEEPALSANEPVYFVAGSRNGLNARFQLSFKYRVFDSEATPVQFFPALGKIHFGYSQTSFWDLNSSSKPFHDTSYRPSLFWQSKIDSNAAGAVYLRSGYEHESNGKDGLSSRSIDTLFVQPVWRKDFSDGDGLFFAPKIYGYLNRTENSDIARYRGYVDWLTRYGDEHGWLLSSRLRTGTAGYGSAQFDLSVPLRKPLFSRTGGFLYFQVFNGYGESLIDYNKKSPAQLRVGFSIVR